MITDIYCVLDRVSISAEFDGAFLKRCQRVNTLVVRGNCLTFYHDVNDWAASSSELSLDCWRT